MSCICNTPPLGRAKSCAVSGKYPRLFLFLAIIGWCTLGTADSVMTGIGVIFVTVYGEEEHGTAKIILKVLLKGWCCIATRYVFLFWLGDRVGGRTLIASVLMS